MRFVPYEYQRYCTEYIKTHPIAALFLDMGLGKTVITLSAIKDLMLETFEVNKVLIIAPLRVARDTWPAEIEKWDHLKGLDISVIVGDVKTRIAAVHHPAMIYIVNRENIRWLVEYYEKNGMRWDFSMIVIDELSSFKNYQSQRFKFLRKGRIDRHTFFQRSHGPVGRDWNFGWRGTARQVYRPVPGSLLQGGCVESGNRHRVPVCS